MTCLQTGGGVNHLSTTNFFVYFFFWEKMQNVPNAADMSATIMRFFIDAFPYMTEQ